MCYSFSFLLWLTPTILNANVEICFVLVKLAMSMLPLFDPTLEQSLLHDVKEANLIPVFKEPKIWAGTLPGMV